MLKLQPESTPSSDASVPGSLGQGTAGFRPHVPALDGIRGLAVLLIMAQHLLQSNGATGNRILDVISAVRATTWVGVDLFFVLSGFLITGILFDSLYSDGYFKNFYLRRILRIFPLYYGFLLLLICLTYPLHLEWHGTQYILLTYTQNLGIFTKDWTGFRPASFVNLNHFWSLAVEEQFYFVWPLIVFFVRDVRKLIFTALTLSVAALILRIVLVSNGADSMLIYVSTGCRADSLMIGGGLALLLRTKSRPVLLRYSAFMFSALLLVLLSAGLRPGGLDIHNRFVKTFGYSIVAVIFASLIGATIARAAWTRVAFENSFMRFFGKYSYGIYVFHYSLDAALTVPLRRWLLPVVHSKTLSVLLSGFIVALLCVATAVISYQVYEKRFLKLKRYFEPQVRIRE
jgi:peptidoglycan/LPS O-acetylase OafA/YrhL